MYRLVAVLYYRLLEVWTDAWTGVFPGRNNGGRQEAVAGGEDCSQRVFDFFPCHCIVGRGLGPAHPIQVFFLAFGVPRVDVFSFEWYPAVWLQTRFLRKRLTETGHFFIPTHLILDWTNVN